MQNKLLNKKNVLLMVTVLALAVAAMGFSVEEANASGIKIIVTEKVSGKIRCYDLPVKQKSTFAGVSGSKLDIVTNHKNSTPLLEQVV